MNPNSEAETTDCTDEQSSSSVTPWMERLGQCRSKASLHPCHPCHPWFSLPALGVNSVGPGPRARFEWNSTSDKLPRRFASPGGRTENSPAFQRWVRWPNVVRPEGTAESCECHGAIAVPILWQKFSRPFGTRFHTATIPPLKGWADLNSPSGRQQSATLLYDRSATIVAPRPVAQISNLLYRRLAVGWPSEGRKPFESSGDSQITNLRYSRVELCATPSARCQTVKRMGREESTCDS